MIFSRYFFIYLSISFFNYLIVFIYLFIEIFCLVRGGNTETVYYFCVSVLLEE